MYMYAVAITADLLGIIPGLNIIADIGAALILGFLGYEKGINIFYSDTRVLGTLVTFFLEAIPSVSFFPMWTLRVFLARRTIER